MITLQQDADGFVRMNRHYPASVRIRIAFNDGISQDFVPAKRHFRSETVDSQRGEAEWRGGNLYFDQWDYRFEWQMLPTGNDATSAGGDNFNTTVGETRG